MGYEVVQLDDRSYRIHDDGTVQIFLFIGTEKALLIDSGYGRGDLKGVVESLTDLPVMLVNTHADWDHISGNKQFPEAFMHPEDFEKYQQTANKEEWEASSLKAVHDGDVIDIGGRRFEVIWIPGHTPGSIALLDPDNRILISGDSAQGGTIVMWGVGRNMDHYIGSLKKLYGMRERFDIIYPSHGSFPAENSILEDLIEKVTAVKNGEITGTDDPRRPGAKIYDIGIARLSF